MIAAFTRFDCVNLATTQARRVLIPLMFVIVMGIALPFSTAPVLIGALVVVASLSYPFQADERGLLDTLYATTSVTRRDVVIGRYLTVLLYAIFATGIGVIVSLVDDTVRHQQFEWPAMASALLAAFALVVVGVSVQLPVYFALGFTKARPVVFIPILVIGVGIVVAIRSGLFKGAESGVMSWVSSPASLILLLVAGIALVVLSVLLSLARYKRREL